MLSEYLKYRSYIALLIFVSALVVRIDHLDSESLFMDELRQVGYYSASSTFEVAQLAATQQQPPLDYWIGHWLFKWSSSDFMARLPAAIFGSGSIALFFLVSLRCMTLPVALLVTCVLILNPFHVYYSQEARPYAISI